MQKKAVTTDDLAMMVQKGFAGIEGNFSVVEEKTALREEVNGCFNIIEKRLDKIEKLILSDHFRWIEKFRDGNFRPEKSACR